VIITYDQTQGRIQSCPLGGANPLSFPVPPLTLPSHPLEVGPINPVRGSGGAGSAVSSPSGVWGRAPAEIEFGAF